MSGLPRVAGTVVKPVSLVLGKVECIPLGSVGSSILVKFFFTIAVLIRSLGRSGSPDEKRPSPPILSFDSGLKRLLVLFGNALSLFF